jgi:hypothetical protein
MFDKPEFGSLDWAIRTDGLVTSRYDQAQLMVQFGKLLADRIPKRIAARRNLGSRPRATFDIADLRVPDTRAAKEAAKHLADTLDPVWEYHSYRTYAWAYILGRHDGLEFDEEVLYVSSLLHDLGLADSNQAVRQRCFSLPAAEHATSLARRCGWDSRREYLIGDVITRHVNLWITPESQPEAYLLHLGTKLDVVGLRYYDLAPQVVDDVLERYPRLGFKRVFRPKMRAHGAAVPDSRAGFYAQHFSSDKHRAHSPFEE